jgi:hypothetical protein
MKTIVAALPFLMLLAAAAQPETRAPVVGDSKFFALDGGQAEPRETTTIPLRAGQCYGWALRVEPEERTIPIREVFDLPAAGNWNSSAETETSAVSGNRRTAVTEFQAPLNQGVITHAWCVADGDPAGPHRIRVYHGDTLLHDFHFTLVTEIH